MQPLVPSSVMYVLVFVEVKMGLDDNGEAELENGDSDGRVVEDIQGDDEGDEKSDNVEAAAVGAVINLF